jgi:molybdopterin molybdotransferase
MTVLSFTDARRAVELVASRLDARETESVSLLAALNRILAEPVIADRDIPPFPRAARDGFAVRAADVLHAPVTLRVLGEIRAGADPASICAELQPRTAVEIMTGASVPNGANAVVMVEHTSNYIADTVDIQRSALAGTNVAATGSEARAGETLLKRGSRMSYVAIAAAASVGRSEVTVFTKPRVAILSTGDEVVDINARPGPYQIRNSNSYSVAVQVTMAGGEPVVLPIAPDEPERLQELIAEGLKHDLLLMTGGVSMGKHDLVEPVLEKLNATIHFTGAYIQPGKPIVFGEAEPAGKRTPFFGLPGNPVSTMVTFELFVRPVIDALNGARPSPLLFTKAKLGSPIRARTGLTRFLPATLSGSLSDTSVELVRWHGSGDFVATARANCYIVVPPDRENIPDGEYVSILLRGVEI